MKNTKIILSLILALVLLIGAMPLTAVAVDKDDLADTGATIQYVYAEVTAPKPGEHPSYSVTAGNSAYTLSYVWWYAVDAGGNSTRITESDTFQVGYQYTVGMYVDPVSGYELAASDKDTSTVNAYINGNKALKRLVYNSAASSEIWIEYTFPTLTNTVVSSAIADVNIPRPGLKPSYYAWVEEPTGGYEIEDYDGTYYTDGVYWYDETNKKVIYSTNTSFTFVENNQYTVRICLKPKYGYTFTQPGSFKGWVNGMESTEVISRSGTEAGTSIILKRTFTCKYNQWSLIEFSGVSVPYAGEYPNYTEPVSAAQNVYNAYTGTVYTNSYFKNGIAWYNNTDSCYVDFYDQFEPNHSYSCYIAVKACEGCRFNDSGVTGKINGSPATVTDISGVSRNTYRLLKYTFSTNHQITSVAVSGVTAPVEGQQPKFSVTLPSGVNYSVEDLTINGSWINGVIWYNDTDKEYMNTSDTFVSGKTYILKVSLVRSGDYIFVPSVTGTLNGKKAQIVRYDGGRYNIGVQYTFTCGGITKVSSVSVTATAPVAGQKASYTCSVPAGAGYSVWDYNYTTYLNGIQWSRIEGGNAYHVGSSETFTEGKQYRVIVLLKPDADHQFVTNTTGTINGNTASVRISGVNPDCRYLEYTFTCAAASAKSEVSGSFTSYLDTKGIVTFELLQGSTVKYSTSAAGNDGEYLLMNVTNGAYTLRVSKANHVTREYPVTVSGDTTQDVKICPLGDANNDGIVNAKDVTRAYRHALEAIKLTGYEYDCANVATKNPDINASDVTKIFRHVLEIEFLWT